MIKQFNLKYPTSSLHLFGSQMKKNESCYTWAQKMNLTNNVNFIGHIEHIQLMKIFNKFDTRSCLKSDPVFVISLIFSNDLLFLSCNNRIFKWELTSGRTVIKFFFK